MWSKNDRNVRLSAFDWFTGEPTNSGNNEDCLALASANYQYRWNDDKCTKRLHFICEKTMLDD